MKSLRLVAWVVALLLAVSAVGYAQEAKPAKPEKKPAAPKVGKPWSDIASLTDEQKAKIVEIQKKNAEAAKELADKIKALKEAEKTEIMAVLTPEQQAELKAAQEKAEAEAKAKKAEMEAKKKAEAEKKNGN